MKLKRVLNGPMPESPVETARKAGPCGDGQWRGYSYVYKRLAEGAEAMARRPYVRLSDDHVQTMADLGSGHEERMKWRLWWLRTYGYVE